MGSWKVPEACLVNQARGTEQPLKFLGKWLWIFLKKADEDGFCNFLILGSSLESGLEMDETSIKLVRMGHEHKKNEQKKTFLLIMNLDELWGSLFDLWLEEFIDVPLIILENKC